MKTLIVFYSRDGHTKKVAETLAQEMKADLEEIIDFKNRRGIIGWLCAGRDAMKKNLTKIKTGGQDPSNYDLVVIGTPIWGWTVVPAARTFLLQNKDKIKKVAFFCTLGGSGDKNAFTEMENICGKKPLAMLAVKQEEVDRSKFTSQVIEFSKKL